MRENTKNVSFQAKKSASLLFGQSLPASTIRLDIPVLDFNKLLNLTLQNADPRPSGKFLGVRYNIDDELVGISTTVEQR